MYATRLESWQRIWRSLARPHQLEALYEAVVAAHAEAHRVYHTLGHVQTCLAHLARYRALAEHRAEVALALWFHDAVYSSWRRDNERQSATWVARELRARGAGEHVCQHIEQLVLVTDHRRPATSADERLIVDLDLIVLGSPPESYTRYAEAVRREHRWVPGRLYRHRRAQLVERLLRSDSIYRTPAIAKRYEHQARTNLQRELDRLRGS
jgi:predicted metal-dependent HD superfamily phosphohydrolase